MLSIGKLGTGQAKYYLDQADGRVDVVQSVAGGVEDYYPARARHAACGSVAARASSVSSARSARSSCDRCSRGSIRGRVIAAALDQPGPCRRVRPDVLGAEERQRAVRARRHRDRARRARPRREGGVRVSGAQRGERASRARRDGRRSRPTGSSPRRSGIGRRAPAIRSCTRTSSSRTSRAATDGKWSTLDGRRLYAHARAASFIYQAVLRAELTRELGVEWTGARTGSPRSSACRTRSCGRSAGGGRRSRRRSPSAAPRDRAPPRPPRSRRVARRIVRLIQSDSSRNGENAPAALGFGHEPGQRRPPARPGHRARRATQFGELARRAVQRRRADRARLVVQPPRRHRGAVQSAARRRRHRRADASSGSPISCWSIRAWSPCSSTTRRNPARRSCAGTARRCPSPSRTAASAQSSSSRSSST